MKLIAHIDIAQEVQPANYGTVRGPIGRAIEQALQDLEIPHVNGLAVVRDVDVTVTEDDTEAATRALRRAMKDIP